MLFLLKLDKLPVNFKVKSSVKKLCRCFSPPYMPVTKHERRNMIGTFFMESPMNQVSDRYMDCSNETTSNIQEKKMKSKKTRRGKPRKWSMNDLLDQRPNLAVSPEYQKGSPCTSPQADDTSITPRYRYEPHAFPVGKIHGKKPNKPLRPYNDPGAPHNTTEFLIEDKMDYPFNYDKHLKQTYDSNHFRLAVSSAFDSTSSFEAGFKAYASDGENGATSTSDELSSDSSLSSSYSYDMAQFEEAYENAKAAEQAERNSSLSHNELVSSIKALSKRIIMLERRQRREPKRSSFITTTRRSDRPYISVFSLQDELSRLMEANRQLREENRLLKSQFSVKLTQ